MSRTLRLVPLCAALGAIAAVTAVTAGAEQRIANVSQGTNIALALFPDGQSLVVDLLGRLWRLPSSGGGATQLTPDDEAARHPRISPDGRLIAYQRLVDGQWDLWLLDVASGERRALLADVYDEREPDFASDGRSIVFATNRTGLFSLWRIDVETGVLTQLTAEPGDAAFPTVSSQSEIAYVRREPSGWSLRALLPTGAGVELYRSPNKLTAPSWRDGGGVVVFNEQRAAGAGTPRSSELKMLVLSQDPVVKTLTRSEDVFESRAAWASPGDYFYTADGRIWRRGIAYVAREPVHLFAAVSVDSSTPSPIDNLLDAPGPNPVLGIAGRSRSDDGRVEVFSALGDLWLVERRGTARRLTDDAFVDIEPSVSPDGDFAVFASDRGGFMDLWQVTLPSGVLTQLTRTPAKDYSPVVSPDGKQIAFLETDGFETLGDARLRVLSLPAGGSARTLATQLGGAELPEWHGLATVSVARWQIGSGAAARTAFDVATGRSAAASAQAVATAQATQAEGGLPRPLPELEWRPAMPDEPYVVQVGRLFDAIRADYLRHVDVHVEGQRIKAIVARGLLPLPARVIDMRDATIIPGLIDVHAHQSSILGERLGRAWLAHGVTTVRELAQDVPAALERAESWASGRRLGPRLIVSPASAAGDPSREQWTPAARPSAVPVRAYSSLRAAPSLFLPSAASPLRWLAAEHDSSAAAYLAPSSPLQLSYEDVFNTLVESRTFVTSSLAAGAGVPAEAGALRRLIEHPTFQRFYTAEERSRWMTGAAPVGSLSALQQNVVRLIRAGGLVAAGTDAPAIPYGLGVHLEMALLAEAGIPADQVLRIATASNALALGLDRQIGTLEAGKLADFLIVQGNPLAEIADALDVIAVVRGGIWLDQERLSGR